MKKNISQVLLQWYDTHARAFPWRMPPGSIQKPNPYHVWASEIMLQQTTVQTVIPYYTRFLKRWPQLNELAKATLDDVLHFWQGLGYYTRARAMHRCAQQVISLWGENFPIEEKALLSLPGIGPYTAAAIRTIAFEQPSVAVDGNIVRVFSRLLCLDSSGESLKKTVRIQASTYLPSSRFGDYTQALMDLGAIVCKPKAPRCLLCPLKSHCKAYISKQTAVYPKLILKRSLPQRFGHFFLLYNPLKKTYFMQQESEKLLRGLWRPCRSPWEDSSQNPKFPIESTWKKCISPLRHTFTHFKLEVNIWYCIISSNDINFEQQGKWLSKEDLKEKGQSTLVKKMWKILAEVPQNSLFL